MSAAPLARRDRRLRAEVARLEVRSMPSTVSFTAQASPTRLVPINPMNQPKPLPSGDLRPVTLAGEVINTPSGGPPTIRYRVFDELGRDMLAGPIVPIPVGTITKDNRYIYNIRIGLSLHRGPNGRHYAIELTVQDRDGSQARTILVTVPRRTFPTLRHVPIIRPR